jgi:viroplasmin and RNaseH domain-containing protein
MPKVTVEFDSIEEAKEFLEGNKWKAVVVDLHLELRATTKYGSSLISPSTEAKPSEIKSVSKVRELLYKLINEYNLSIDE